MSVENIKLVFQKSISVKQAILDDEQFLKKIEIAANMIVETYQKDGKVLFCGNGGSAADAQHLAAELSGRFYYDRPPLYAEALHVNSSYYTAVANDYSNDVVYQRMVQAAGKNGDVLVAISTSGNSKNILNAIIYAKKQGMKVIGFTGETGGQMVGVCDVLFNVPTIDTPRVQEVHILIGHILCELVESSIFPK